MRVPTEDMSPGDYEGLSRLVAGGGRAVLAGYARHDSFPYEAGIKFLGRRGKGAQSHAPQYRLGAIWLPCAPKSVTFPSS